MRIVFGFLLALIVAFPTPSKAQQALMSNFYYEIAVVRAPAYADGDFTIRLTSPSSVTGCLSIEKPEIEIVDAGAVLYMTLKGGTVELNRDKRYGQYGCDKNMGPNYAEVTLNKNKLEENGTYKIDLKGEEAGRIYDIKIETDENSVTLTAQMSVNGTNINEEKIIQHWFLPDNTIILSSNNMTRNAEIKDKVKQVAEKRGFTPLEEIYESFKGPDDKLYYVDTKNSLKDTLGDTTPAIMGNIGMPEMHQGSKGAFTRKKVQAVYAKRPSIFESSTMP